jgi:cytochrome c5
MLTRIVFLVLITLVLSCKSTKTTTPPAAKPKGPSQADVDRVATKIANYTLPKLLKGKTLYADNCGSCHRLYAPSSRTEVKWKSVVPPMVNKVNKSAQNLSAEEQELITNYLITMCSVPEME